MVDLDLSALDSARIPNHVGLILDGNGRWASARGLPRTAGHLAGEKALFDSVEAALAIGIRWLTAFTFSTENWNRSEEEVNFLMWFNEDLLFRRRDELNRDGVRMHFAGDLADPRVPDRNRQNMRDAEVLTAANDRLDLVFAFNYGGRSEIVAAARQIAAEAVEGHLDPSRLDEATFARHLFVPEMPDLDLVIRSSGEYRISNFLLWQAAYAELVFPPVLWPDFTPEHLLDCVLEFQRRRRRFGGAAPAS